MKDKTKLTVCAMLCITALEITNMVFFGVDGVILSGVIGVLCGLAGYKLKR